MRKFLLVAAAAAMASAMPALAKPGKGQGAGHGAHGKSGTVVSGGKARTDSRANARAKARTGANVVRIRDRDGDGIPDSRDRFDNRAAGRYGVNACPPGLAAKGNGCLPPGQARRLFTIGQRIPTGYNFYTPYAQIPVGYREQYGLVNDGRYIYRDDAIYVVDPATSLVTRIIDLMR